MVRGREGSRARGLDGQGRREGSMARVGVRVRGLSDGRHLLGVAIPRVRVRVGLRVRVRVTRGAAC